MFWAFCWVFSGLSGGWDNSNSLECKQLESLILLTFVLFFIWLVQRQCIINAGLCNLQALLCYVRVDGLSNGDVGVAHQLAGYEGINAGVVTGCGEGVAQLVRREIADDAAVTDGETLGAGGQCGEAALPEETLPVLLEVGVLGICADGCGACLANASKI